MPGKHYTNEQKRKAAQMAIKHKANGGQYSEVAEIVGCHMTMIGKWVDAYRLGKLDEKPNPPAKPPPKSPKAEKEIDIRPDLKNIANAIDNLTIAVKVTHANINQACIRLDAIYSKLTEHENIASEIGDEINGE